MHQPFQASLKNTPTAYYWPNIAACVSIWVQHLNIVPPLHCAHLTCCCTFRALTVTMCFHYCLNWTGSGFCDFLLSEFILFSLVGRTCYCRCFGVESYPASMCTLIEIHNRDITCSFSCRLMKCLLWNWCIVWILLWYGTQAWHILEFLIKKKRLFLWPTIDPKWPH